MVHCNVGIKLFFLTSFYALFMGIPIGHANLLEDSALSEDQYVDINIWSRHKNVAKSFIKGDGVGHVSITIHGKDQGGNPLKTYASFWPKDTPNGLSPVPQIWHIPTDDQRAEGHAPDKIIRLYSLNSRDIYNHFNSALKKTDLGYQLCKALPRSSDVEYSCASFGTKLISVGGGRELLPKDDSTWGTLKVVGKRAFGPAIASAGFGLLVGGPVGALAGAFLGTGAFSFRGIDRGLAQLEEGHEIFSFHQVTPGDVLDFATKFSEEEKSTFKRTITWPRDVTGAWDVSPSSLLYDISTTMTQNGYGRKWS